MSVDGVNGKQIKADLHSIAKEHGVSRRKERIETLEAIAEKGKELLDDLSAMDKTVYDVVDEMDDLMDELEDLEAKQAAAQAKIEVTNKKLGTANERLAVLDEKAQTEDGLTEAEQEEYNRLRASIKDYKYEAKTHNATLGDLAGNVKSLNGKMSDTLYKTNGIAEKMEDYSDAGNEIKASAKKYGRDIDCEKVMERNETSWWNIFSRKGNGDGKQVQGAAEGAIAGAAVIGVTGQAVGTLIAGTKIGAALGSCFGPVGCAIGIAAGVIAGGTVGLLKSKGETQMDKFLDKMDMEEIADQTFQDSVDHKFMSEYEAIEAKGGNQVGGKLRKATVKVFSYGKSISAASDKVKSDVDKVKSDYSGKIDMPDAEDTET